MEKIPFTPQGLETIKQELAHLKGSERQDVIRAIAEAREHGDLSENAEYHAARERQSFIEGRISELEDVTSRAEVIDATKADGREGDLWHDRSLLPMRIRTRNRSSILSAPMRRTSIAGLSRHHRPSRAA